MKELYDEILREVFADHVFSQAEKRHLKEVIKKHIERAKNGKEQK